MCTGLISIGFLGLGAGPTATRDSPSYHPETKIMKKFQMHTLIVRTKIKGTGVSASGKFFTSVWRLVSIKCSNVPTVDV
jgi:hypothetical protein